MRDLHQAAGMTNASLKNQMAKQRLRDEINADIDRFVDLKTETMKVIDAVPDEDDRCVLERYFLQGKSYTVIGMEMKYNKDYVYKIIKRALKKYKFLKMYYAPLW